MGKRIVNYGKRCCRCFRTKRDVRFRKHMKMEYCDDCYKQMTGVVKL